MPIGHVGWHGRNVIRLKLPCSLMSWWLCHHMKRQERTETIYIYRNIVESNQELNKVLPSDWKKKRNSLNHKQAQIAQAKMKKNNCEFQIPKVVLYAQLYPDDISHCIISWYPNAPCRARTEAHCEALRLQPSNVGPPVDSQVGGPITPITMVCDAYDYSS